MIHIIRKNVHCNIFRTFCNEKIHPVVVTTIRVVSQKITQINLFCHLQPALYSHAGNVLFLGWEYFIPKVGTTQDNKERVLRNKGWLLNNKGWLLNNKGWLLNNKGWLLENKRRLSLDLTWFLGKVPK